jgi:DNA primase
VTGPSREDILAAFPLLTELEKDGIKLIGTGSRRTALCPLHSEKSPSFSVNVDKNLFHCFGCQKGGSLIDYIALRDGKSPEDVLKELSEKLGRMGGRLNSNKPVASNAIATYVYRSATGAPVYQVLRYEPKDFRQQKWTGSSWAWGMDGVQRVLYNLPEVLAAGEKPVVIVEGEKDADNLTKLGWIATTNVGGAGKWMEGYADALNGRSVVVCGDNATGTARSPAC